MRPFRQVTDDPEGDALEREIQADREELRMRRRRRLLFAPPLVALAIAAWARGVSRPREVFGARVYAGAQSPPNQPLRVRVEVVRAVPGIEGAWAATGLALRPTADGVRGRAETTDDRGISEVVIDAPVPNSVTIEAQLPDGAFHPIGSLSPAALPPPDPKHGALSKVRRTGGTMSGELKVAVAPELGALAPPLSAAVWIRVRDAAGAPVAGAALAFVAEGGLSGDPAPATSDAGGLARVPVSPIAAPVVLTVQAQKGDKRGGWSGIVGSVLGSPRPTSDGRLLLGSKSIELMASASHGLAYFDLWRSGVRVGGGKVRFDGGRAMLPLPDGLDGVIDLEANPSPFPSSADDLAHAATWPLVLAKDEVDAWGAIATSPRFDEHVPSSGTIASYGAAVAATIAFAPPAVPARPLVSDGLKPGLTREFARGRAVRRAASAAVVGGGVLELGLMIALGVFAAPPTVEDAMHALGERPPSNSKARSKQLLGVLLAGIGIVALLFAALATMAWGMP
ncbi:MAG: hypothetical protein HYV09_01275 [Deltaproteobacteria bacterium]|nr:hypothetical protein [Deltaproteobacteria bacterium]